MRIEVMKFLAVLVITLFIATPTMLILPQTYWWVAYVIAFFLSIVIHEPVAKWIEENAPR